MTRYKGRASAKSIARDFPFTVEITVPEFGLGKRIDPMYAFHAQRGIQVQRGPGRREGERDIIRWCFLDPAIAQAFALEFDGTLILPPTIL
jgi:hypothetical protein